MIDPTARTKVVTISTLESVGLLSEVVFFSPPSSPAVCCSLCCTKQVTSVHSFIHATLFIYHISPCHLPSSLSFVFLFLSQIPLEQQGRRFNKSPFSQPFQNLDHCFISALSLGAKVQPDTQTQNKRAQQQMKINQTCRVLNGRCKVSLYETD